MKSKKIDLKHLLMSALVASGIMAGGLLVSQPSKALDLSKAADASTSLCPQYICLPPGPGGDPEPEPEPEPNPTPTPDPEPPLPN